MADVSVSLNRIAPLGAADNTGLKIGFVDSAVKVAQNDTWTVGEASEVIWASVTTDATGVADPVTISGKEIVLTSVAAGPASGVILYR